MTDRAGPQEELGLVVLEGTYRCEAPLDLELGQEDCGAGDAGLRRGLLVCASIHSALGRSLRAGACLTGEPTCEGCPYSRECAFGAIWEAQIVGAPGGLTQLKPYVLEPVDDPKSPQAEGLLRVRLKLLGVGRGFLPHVVHALHGIDRLSPPAAEGKVAAELIDLTRLRPASPGTNCLDSPLLDAGAPLPDWWATLGATPDAAPISLRLHLETPVDLKRGSAEDPIDLARYLLLRFDRLLEYVERLPEPEPGLRKARATRLREEAAACRLLDANLRSLAYVRQRSTVHPARPKRVPHRGEVGNLTFANVSPDVASLWRTAAAIHLGRGTTFGFGKIRVEAL